MAGKSKKPVRIAVSGPIPKLTVSMPLDEKKIKAIHKCIEKGMLEVTLSKVDLATGDVGDSWLYD
jgi:hypothetical protein